MINQLAVNAIRILSADAVQKANSGHPGLPLGAAPMAYELWANHMNHNPNNSMWKNRDRFVLSAGHGSALLYSLLHLFGYGNLGIEDLQAFRQLGSLTPGHPEYRHTIGVEATTGPLGAGLGMAVGMAMAEAHLAGIFNQEAYPIMDHYTYALCGDGCLMEGISSEVLSLAGTLRLNKLILLYDSNDISIEGSTTLAFTEHVEKRMEGFGFQVLVVEDGNDLQAIGKAISKAKGEPKRPTFIKIKTKIGYGVPEKEGKASAHGEPLGVENIKILRKNLGWSSDEAFAIPKEVYEHYQALGELGKEKENNWNQLYKKYERVHPELAVKFNQYYSNEPVEINFEHMLEEKPDATRNISGEILNYIKDEIPNMIGGSADLAPSTKSVMKQEKDFCAEQYAGRNIHFGVRELGMTAIGNGIMLHGGLRAYVSTFLVFADYMKPMIRLSALMGIPLTMILTHDSIGVGEDGPTHEPVEQLTMLRAIPNVYVFRPADTMETKAGWQVAMRSTTTPTVLALTRQSLPILNNTSMEALKGGYILEKEAREHVDGILLATGSEVHLAVKAKVQLEKEDFSIRVVSMPCMDLFEEQTELYKENILPRGVKKRVAIEAGSKLSWGNYVGLDGGYVTMDTFGASAPASQLFEKYGFTVGHIIEVTKEIMKR